MKNLTLKSAFLFINVILLVFVSQAQSIEGTVKDPYSNEIKPFVNVILKQNDQTIANKTTDLEGYFFFDNLKSGNYTVVLMALGAEKIINDINIDNTDLTYSFEFDDAIVGTMIDVNGHRNLIPKGKLNIIGGDVLDTQKPTTMIEVLAQVPTAVETSEGISFKGARPGTAVYYIDGIRTYGDLYIPMGSVKNIEVYTGGVPAQYGNSTSGVIVVETKSYKDYL